MVVDAKGVKVHEGKSDGRGKTEAEKTEECRHFMPVCWRGAEIIKE